MIHQEDQILMDRAFVNDMQIIQYKDKLFFELGEIIHQIYKQPLYGKWFSCARGLGYQSINPSLAQLRKGR